MIIVIIRLSRHSYFVHFFPLLNICFTLPSKNAELFCIFSYLFSKIFWFLSSYILKQVKQEIVYSNFQQKKMYIQSVVEYVLMNINTLDIYQKW